MSEIVKEALAILKEAKINANEAVAALDRIASVTGSPDHVAAVLALIRSKLLATQGQHLRLAEMLIRVERRQSAANSMRFENPVYWSYLATGARDGPYCARCWEAARKVSSLRTLPFRGHDRWVCGTCKKTFFSEGAAAAIEAAGQAASAKRSGPLSGLIVED